MMISSLPSFLPLSKAPLASCTAHQIYPPATHLPTSHDHIVRPESIIEGGKSRSDGTVEVASLDDALDKGMSTPIDLEVVDAAVFHSEVDSIEGARIVRMSIRARPSGDQAFRCSCQKKQAQPNERRKKRRNICKLETLTLIIGRERHVAEVPISRYDI